MYKIGIIDDHPIFRMGLTTLLNQHPTMEVIYSLEDIRDFHQLPVNQYPDLWVVDVSLKQGNGLDLVTYCVSQKTNQKVIVLSMYDEHLYGERALRAGAVGYIKKTTPPDELLRLIEKGCQGHLSISDQFKDFLVHHQIQIQPNTSDERDPVLVYLSDRELEVFIQLGQGKKAANIADDLKVSIKTIDSHLHNIKRKLGTTHMVELICKAAVWVNDQHQVST